MFKRNKICTAALAALGGTLLVTSLPVLAQGQTVEVTGSRIKRIDAETALPVVTIKAADLERAGVQTAEAAVQFIAQNQSTVNSSRSIGSTNGGAAYADLRGLGVERTLVLLNGQRVVKNPYSGIATDLNVIPTVAIERIEVLTDGASSIYGTDAIAGVINIIDGIQGNNGAPYLNPFGDQTAAGLDYILASKVIGEMQDINGKLFNVGASVSGNLFNMPAGAVGVAAGVEYRKEEIEYKNNFTLIRQAASSGLELAEDTTGDISNFALFGEANFPITKTLEIPVSIRYDDTGDTGSKWTPKIGARWQALPSTLIRASYNKGFRAPGVFDLYAPNSITFTSNSYDDPVLCPNGVPVAGADPSRDCGQQFRQLQGGSKSVESEESTAWSMGIVFEIMSNVTIGLDYFNYEVEGTIGALPETAIFGDTARYADKFVRCSTLSAADQAAIDACVPGTVDPLAYIKTTTTNLGNIRTEGWDIAFSASQAFANYGRFSFTLNGTYMTKWEQQLVAGGEYFSALGRYSVDLNFPAPRYQQVSRLGWDMGSWSTGLFHRYKRGYQDYNLDTLDDAVYGNNRVDNWSVFDLSVTYTGIKGLALTAGVLNLMDEDPPFSNQGATFQVGYDPRITDPVGRAFLLQASYQF